MASSNGRLKTSELTAIPAVFHTHGTTAYLEKDAADAYLRVAYAFEKRFGRRLVSMSFYRPLADQIRIFLKNYYKVSRARRRGTSDRSFNGSTYAKRSGMSPVASPGYSNHGLAVTVDFNSGIQRSGSEEFRWMQSEGTKYGWDWTEGKRVGEPWHWGYKRSQDKMRSAPKASATGGTSPVKIPATAVVTGDLLEAQKNLAALGYEPGPIDGSLGSSTRTATKKFQEDFGLEADGVPGPDTRKALVNAMSKLDEIYAVVVENQKRIDRLTAVVSPGKEGVRRDGELAKLIRDSRNAVIDAVSPGKAGVRHDSPLVQVIKSEGQKTRDEA